MARAGSETRRLGPYTLIDRIGRGGMGEVFVARRDGATDVCVLKQLHQELAQSPLSFRLKREANVLSQLNHPNIASVRDAGIVDDVFYIALEFIEGQTVRGITRRLGKMGRPLPAAVAIQIASEVLDGLQYAHGLTDPDGSALDLVHRDLSPNNVMLSYQGEVKIIDFGIASGKLDDFQTKPGIILGTMRYISPEQAMSKPVDRRSDLYTLGAVLYEMLTGLPVVERGDHSKILGRVLRGKPKPFSEVASSLPDRLWTVVAKALQKRPADRFRSALEFKEALVDARGDIPIPTRGEIGRFLAEIFPPEQRRQQAQVLAPQDDTFSAPESPSEEDIAVPTKSEMAPDPVRTVVEAQQATATGPNPMLPTVDPIAELPSAPTIVESAARALTPAPRNFSGAPIPSPRAKAGRTTQIIAGVAALLALLAVGLVFGSWRSPEPPSDAEPAAKEVAARPEITVRPEVAVVARPAPPADPTPPPVVETQAAPVPPPVIKRTRRLTKAKPAGTPPPTTTPKRTSTLRKKLQALQLTPKNMPLMLQLQKDVEAAARELPPVDQGRVVAQLRAAVRAGNVDGMAQAIRSLERAQAKQ